MKIRKIIILLLLVFLIPLNVKAISSDYKDKVSSILKVEQEEDKINIYIFYGEGCPHCAKEIPILEKIINKYNNVNLYKYETFNDKDNQTKMLVIKTFLGVKPEIDVPFTVIGTHTFLGYSEETARKIEQNVADYLEIKDEIKYIVDEDKVDIPFIGKESKDEVNLIESSIAFGLKDAISLSTIWIVILITIFMFDYKDKKKTLIITSILLLLGNIINSFEYINYLKIDVINQTIKYMLPAVLLIYALFKYKNRYNVFNKNQKLVASIVLFTLLSFYVISHNDTNIILKELWHFNELSEVSMILYLGIYYFINLIIQIGISIFLLSIFNIVFDRIKKDKYICIFKIIISIIIAVLLFTLPDIFF